MLEVSIGILIALTVVNFLVSRRVLHPAVVFAVIWSLQLLGLLLFRNRFVEPLDETLLVIVIGAVCFSIGSYLSLITLTSNSGRAQIVGCREIKRDSVLYLISAVIVALCLYGQYRIFSELLNNDSLASTLVYARTLMSIENEDIYGLYKYGSPIAIGMLLAMQIVIVRKEANVLHKILVVYFFITALCMAVLSTGRWSIALIFVLIGIVYLLNDEGKKVGRRVGVIIAALSALTFLVFWLMGSVMGKAEDEAVGAIGNLVEYLFSSIPALSVYINRNPISLFGGEWGLNTFRFFFALAAAIGLVDKPPSLVQEFIPVPHLTNLYTTYLPYLKDFGWTGFAAVPLFLGFIHDRLFQWSTRDSRNELVFYFLAISYLPLLQTVFQETHFSLLSSWIQFVLIGFFITKSVKVKEETVTYGR